MCEEVVCYMFVSFLFVVFQILKLVNCKRPNDTLDTKTLKEILKEREKTSEVMNEQEQGTIGGVPVPEAPQENNESFASTEEGDPLRAPLSILIKVTKAGGESLPYGEVSTELVEEIFQNGAGVRPLEVLVLNDQVGMLGLGTKTLE